MLGVVFSLVAVGSASATTTVGQLFAPDTACGILTYLQTGVASGNPYTVPSAGTITSWKFQTDATVPGGLKLKVGRSAGGGMYTIVGESIAGTLTPSAVNGPFPANIPVNSGDLLGIFANGGDCGQLTSSAADSWVGVNNDQPPGSTSAYNPSTKARFPVQAVVTAPPSSTLMVPGCSQSGVSAGMVSADTGTTPKALHFKVDGGAEQVAATTGAGAVSITSPEGSHSDEYWGEDQLGQLESPHHTVNVLVDRTAPTVTITSDQGKTVYNAGEHASVTTKASDTGSGLASDPSGTAQPASTAHAGGFSVARSATDNCGNVGSSVFTYTVKPVDSPLVLSNFAFFAALRGPATIGRVTGTRVSYDASDAGTTAFAVFRAMRGVKSGTLCVAPRKRGHGTRCTRFAQVGAFSHNDKAGTNSFRFTGRVGGKPLKPGNYRLDAAPTITGLTGPTVSANFRIKR